jgi:phosphoribosylaminoimidazole-succinocarboxamide synthase
MGRLATMDALTSVEVPGLERHSKGKVRDIFDLNEMLLIVTSDRISAFDVVLPTGIPAKGHVLSQLSAFWFEALSTAHHLVSAGWPDVAAAIERAGGEPSDALAGRSMLVWKAEPVPLECVVRGYISGSLWKEYTEAGGPAHAVAIHGLHFPEGLQESQPLDDPIFTPSTKAATAHDEALSRARAAELVGESLLEELEDRSLDLYCRGADHARRKGLILADTKFEFGFAGGELLLIDEALTPDSSRYWDLRTYRPGRPQPSFDKQFVRDYLETLDWDKRAPGPGLPASVVAGTSERYREAFRRLTGREPAHL